MTPSLFTPELAPVPPSEDAGPAPAARHGASPALPLSTSQDLSHALRAYPNQHKENPR